MRKTGILKSSILFMAVLVVSNQVVGAITETERQALIALYNSTNGDHWTHKDNWLGPPGTENTWYGVRCVNDEVIFIGLENNNLVGQIPPELDAHSFSGIRRLLPGLLQHDIRWTLSIVR